MIKETIDEKIPIKIWTTDIESAAREQLKKLAKMPFIYKHIAVMPDVHCGVGSSVGTVIASKGAIIPSAVGVDIGCGMRALRLPFNTDMIVDKLKNIRHEIERCVPVGFNKHKEINEERASLLKTIDGELNCFCKDTEKTLKNAILQLGTLGGGNHFIEICTDENQQAWVMLHSGSRNIGKSIADLHITNAKNLMKSYFIDLPDQDLAYLVQGTSDFYDYIQDMNWAQQYASKNRELMMKIILRSISHVLFKDLDISRFADCLEIDCHHNYTQLESHFGQNVYITRKGAVSAREGQLGIIPGSMGAKSFIVRGLGNRESFCSCSHGAGRKMSRIKAREIFTQEDLIQQTKGVECRKDSDIIDEIPSAYKSIDEVMANQKDLVSIEYTLKQLVCIKG